MKYVLFAALALLGCGKKSEEKKHGAASCDVPALHECMQYGAKTFEMGRLAGVKDGCSRVAKGIYAEADCTTPGRIGRCEMSNGNVLYYYEGHATQPVGLAEDCEHHLGKFSP